MAGGPFCNTNLGLYRFQTQQCNAVDLLLPRLPQTMRLIEMPPQGMKYI